MVGIQREVINAWEQRAPLAPTHVRQLVSGGDVSVLIQPSNRRAYPMQVGVNDVIDLDVDLVIACRTTRQQARYQRRTFQQRMSSCW